MELSWKRQHYQMLGELRLLQTRLSDKGVTASAESAVPVLLGHVCQTIFEVLPTIGRSNHFTRKSSGTKMSH